MSLTRQCRSRLNAGMLEPKATGFQSTVSPPISATLFRKMVRLAWPINPNGQSHMTLPLIGSILNLYKPN